MLELFDNISSPMVYVICSSSILLFLLCCFIDAKVPNKYTEMMGEISLATMCAMLLFWCVYLGIKLVLIIL